MTEKQKQELIEMGFSNWNNYLHYEVGNDNNDYIILEINKYGIIRIHDHDVGLIIGKFKSVEQVQRKMEGMKMLLS